MKRVGHIGRYEFIALTTVVNSTWIFLPLISVLARQAKSASWAGVIGGTAVAYSGYRLTMALIRRFPGKGLTDVTLVLGGPLFGRILVLAYMVLFFSITAMKARVFSEGIASTILPRTPLSVHIGVFAFLVVVASYHSMEAIARLAWLLFPFFFTSLLVILFFNANHFFASGLMPWFGGGVSGIAQASLQVGGVLSQILMVPILYPMVRSQATARRDGSIALFLAMANGLLVTITSAMIFPDGEAARRFFPLFELALLIQLGDFFTRLEVIFVFFWFFAAATMFAANFFLANLCLTRAMGLPGHRPLIPILVVLFYAASFLTPNVIASTQVLTSYINVFGFLVIVVVPILLWVLHYLSGKRSGGRDQARPEPQGGDRVVQAQTGS